MNGCMLRVAKNVHDRQFIATFEFCDGEIRNMAAEAMDGGEVQEHLLEDVAWLTEMRRAIAIHLTKCLRHEAFLVGGVVTFPLIRRERERCEKLAAIFRDNLPTHGPVDPWEAANLAVRALCIEPCAVVTCKENAERDYDRDIAENLFPLRAADPKCPHLAALCGDHAIDVAGAAHSSISAARAAQIRASKGEP